MVQAKVTDFENENKRDQVSLYSVLSVSFKKTLFVFTHLSNQNP